MSSISMLSALTEDLLARVYTKLSSEKERKTWRLVCKDFLRVESVSRRSLRILRLEFLQRLLSKYSNLDSFDLSACPRIEDGTISVILSWPESLNWTLCVTRLSLSRATGLRFSGLEMLVRACPCLQALDVCYCWQYGDREASAISCAKGLRELRMDKCVGVSDVGLAKIAVGCGKLESLSLKWCMEISDLGIDLLCKKCMGLKALDVSYLKVTHESLRSIASLRKLEYLAIVGCPSVDPFGLQFLENTCPLLQVIDVSRCDLVSSSGLMSLVRGHRGLLQLNAGYCFPELPATALHGLKDLKHLNAIRIDGTQVSEFSLQIISTNCKSLVEIGLSKCGVTNKGIMQLVSGCVDLKIVNLTCCHTLTDAALSALANSCRNLVCLKVESCDMVTEKSLDQLGSYCLQLKELDLTDCCGVNDEGLKYLSRCSELSCLKLGLCVNITNRGLAYIARSCTKIIELDLYRCTGIGDDGLAVLLTGCKKMTKLNLSYCSGLTDRGMQYIGHFEDLSELEMRGLVNITSTGLTAIAAGCQSLSDLDLKHCNKIDDSGFWALGYYSRNIRQINMSYCAVSDVGLCMVMGNLTCLLDAKLVHLTRVTVKGFELALRTCSTRIRKVKLISPLRFLLSSELLETLQARGCKIRWD